MRFQRSTLEKIGVVLFVIIGLLTVLIIGQTEINKIKNNMSIGVCYVYKVTAGYKGETNIYYRAKVNTEICEGIKTMRISLGGEIYFSNRWFPFVYKKDETSLNRILIEPSDFKKVNLPFPDSLNWVKKYVSSLNR
jgi:hypothetical protein